MSTYEETLDVAGQVVMELAKDRGAAAGAAKGIEAVVVLERALAIAYAEVFLFKGANPSPERLDEVVRIMGERYRRELAGEIAKQAALRSGFNPQKQ